MELMTALNRLHGGKNIKLPYFIAQLSRYAAVSYTHLTLPTIA